MDFGFGGGTKASAVGHLLPVDNWCNAEDRLNLREREHVGSDDNRVVHCGKPVIATQMELL